MLKKRQILTLVSIAMISFLAGTIFNMNFIATGGDSSPWNKVWRAISELQSKVDSLNASLIEQEARINALEEEPKVKVIRFFEPDETFTDQYHVWVEFARFTWTPQNSISNAILAIRIYYQYNCNGRFGFRLIVNGVDVCAWPNHGWNLDQRPSPGYVWMPMWKIVTEVQGNYHTHGTQLYNKPSYTLAFEMTAESGNDPIYVRNINVILTVVDGIPEYSP